MLCYSDVVGIIGLSVYYTTLQKVNSMHMVFFLILNGNIYMECVYIWNAERERERGREKKGAVSNAIYWCRLSHSCQPTASDSSWLAVPYAPLKGKFF